MKGVAYLKSVSHCTVFYNGYPRRFLSSTTHAFSVTLLQIDFIGCDSSTFPTCITLRTNTPLGTTRFYLLQKSLRHVVQLLRRGERLQRRRDLFVGNHVPVDHVDAQQTLEEECLELVACLLRHGGVADRLLALVDEILRPGFVEERVLSSPPLPTPTVSVWRAYISATCSITFMRASSPSMLLTSASSSFRAIACTSSFGRFRMRSSVCTTIW